MPIQKCTWDEISFVADRPDTAKATPGFLPTKTERIWFSYKVNGDVAAVAALLLMARPRLSVVFVATEHRGKGLGKKMIDHCVAEARKSGHKSIDARSVKLSLFEACGFKPTKEWKSGGWSLERDL